MVLRNQLDRESNSFDFLSGGGEMGRLMRAHDWAATSLGSPDQWPQALRTTVRLMLNTGHPMYIFWGAGHTCLYNDAFSASIGPERHPISLGQAGRAVWEEIWPIIGHQIEQVLSGRGATWNVNHLVPITRHGRYEEVYWTYSYSPIDDETAPNGIGGVLVLCTETTQQVLASRELARAKQDIEKINVEFATTIQQLKAADRLHSFQLRLANSLLVLDAPEEIVTTAITMLGGELRVSRVFYAEVNDDNGTLFIRRDWTMEGYASLAGQTKVLDDYGPDMIAALRAGQVVANHDITLDARTSAHADAYEKIGVRADLLLPLVKQGRLRVILVLHSAQPRRWEQEEIQLAQDMAERTWSAVEAARAQADLRAERDQSQSIFDSMTEGFGLIAHGWTLVRMNAAGLRLVQRSAEKVIGHNYWEVFPNAVGTNIETACRAVMETGVSQTIETRYVLPSSESIWMEVRIYPALKGGLAIFFRDITSRKDFEEELKKEARRKDEFLAMLAHELRNPLAPIGAAAELLQIAAIDEAKVRQTSQVIARQVDHMTSLINDLLDVSRVTRGLAQVKNEPTSSRLSPTRLNRWERSCMRAVIR